MEENKTENMEPVTETVTPAPVEETSTVAEVPSEPAPAEVPTEVQVAPVTEVPTTPVAPVATEPEPKKKGKGGLILIIVLLVVLVGVCVWYFVLGGNGAKKEEKEAPAQGEKQEEPENKIEEFELSEDEAEKLISYVPEATPYDKDKEYSAFDSKKLTTSEMDNNWLIYRAMQDVTNKGECTEEQFELNNLCDFTLSLDDVKESVKNLYGDISIDYLNKVESNFLWHCTLDGNVYACSNSGGGYVTNPAIEYFKLFANTRSFTKFQKAEKDNNNLYVYVKYAKLEMVSDERNMNIQPADITFRIRKYGTGNEVIDENILSGTDYFEENATTTFYDKLYNEFKDKMTTYKLTYKIDGDSYHLVSVETVK